MITFKVEIGRTVDGAEEPEMTPSVVADLEEAIETFFCDGEYIVKAKVLNIEQE